jgi:hypothetical protein
MRNLPRLAGLLVLVTGLVAFTLPLAGQVTTNTLSLGNTGSAVVTFNWTASGDGTVPVTGAQLGNQYQGYFVTQVETVPRSPAPIAGYSVAITDNAGVDFLQGAGSNLSGTLPQGFGTPCVAPPINGTLNLSITNQTNAGARGIVYVFLQQQCIPGSGSSATIGVSAGVPANPCATAGLLDVNQSNGALYSCPTSGGSWVLATGGDVVTSPNATLNVGGSPTATTLDAKTTLIAQKFFGTTAPGSVAGNLPGDTFNDTTNNKTYTCNAPSGTSAPACTSVAPGQWQLAGGSSFAQLTPTCTTGAQNLTTTANTNESYSCTLTGNPTFSFSPSAPTAGAKVRFTFTQDGPGGRGPTMPSGFSTFPTIYPGPNCTTTINGNWDGAAFNLDGAVSYCGGYVPEAAAPTITPGSGNVIPWDDSTDHLHEQKTSTGVIYKFLPPIDPTSYWLKDDFEDKGLGTSGNLGELGWGSPGCATLAQTTNVANHFGILNMQAGAVAGNTCILRLNNSGIFTQNLLGLNALATNQTWEYLTVFQITSGSIATQTIKGGFGSADGDTGTTCAGNCIQWMLDTSVSGNFQLITCATGTCTTTGAAAGAITVAINTWYQIRIYSTSSSTVQMEVKQGANTQTQSAAANIPSGGMTAYYYLKNNNTQPNIQLDYFHFRETNLARY